MSTKTKIILFALFSFLALSLVWENGLSINTVEASNVQSIRVGSGRCNAGGPNAPPYIPGDPPPAGNGIRCREDHFLPTDSLTYRVVLKKFITDDEGEIYVNGIPVYNDYNTCACCSTCQNLDCRPSTGQGDLLACVSNEVERNLNIEITSFRRDGPTPVTLYVKDECGVSRWVSAEFEIYRAVPNDLVSGTLSVLPITVTEGGAYRIAITGQDDNGLVRACTWEETIGVRNCQPLSGTFSSTGWNVVNAATGTHTHCGEIYGYNGTTGAAENAFTAPRCVAVTVLPLPPAQCTLDVYTYESGASQLIDANIYIDGTYRGNQHVALQVQPASHTIRAELSGYQTASQTVSCVSGETKRVNLYLPKIIPSLSVSCVASPNPSQINQSVGFAATAQGGTGYYSYQWSGACSGYSSTCYRSFSQSGNYTANITVASGAQSQSANCSVFVQPAINDPITGTLSASSTSPCARENVIVTITAQDDDGVKRVCLREQGNYEDCQSCSANTSCAKTWQVMKNSIGNYNFYGVAYGAIPGGAEETSQTNPLQITINFRDCTPSLTVSCSASPNPAQANQIVTFTSAASGGTGSYSYQWSGACSSSYSPCYASFASSGTYTATVNATSNSQSQSANCSVFVSQTNPTCTDECSYSGQTRCFDYTQRQTCGNYDSDSCLEWSSAQTSSGSTSCGYGRCSSDQRPSWYCSAGNNDYTCNYDSSCGSGGGQNYLSCYGSDVYWFNSQGSAQNKYQECGDDYCDNWSAGNYCSGSNVYSRRTCYRKGCAGNACYANSYEDNQFVQTCSYGQTCQGGQCSNTQECSSGPCCENGRLKSTTAICDYNIETEYKCPWGAGCGADVGKRTQTKLRYCSGNSSQCVGNWGDWSSWTGWGVADYCSTSETCSAGNSKCQYTASCVAPPGGYIKYYRKACVGKSVYWYDSEAARQDKYRDCEDNNSCTSDSCAAGKCSNVLKCDGTTCAIGSNDYNQYCIRCGDGKCSPGETNKTCPADCGLAEIIISIFAKKDVIPTEWKEDLTLKSDEKVDFLIVVANNTKKTLANLTVKAEIPPEINYKGELKLNGNSVSGDARNGINIGSLTANEVKTITFRGQVLSGDKIETGKTEEAVATVTNTGLFADDSMRLTFEAGVLAGAAAIGLILSGLLGKWETWLLLILLLLFLLFVLFSRKKPKETKV